MTHALNEKFFIPLFPSGYGHRMDVMDGRVSAISQKQISALVDEIGGVSALRNNDKMPLYLDETVSQASNRPGGGGPSCSTKKAYGRKPEPRQHHKCHIRGPQRSCGDEPDRVLPQVRSTEESRAHLFH